MKKRTYIVLLFVISIPIVIAQSAKEFKKIETGNGLELSYLAENSDGENVVFICSEQMPTFPGGFDSLYNFFRATIHYPPKAKKDSIHGRVLTSFVVDWDGKVKDIKTMKSVRYDLDSACIDLVSKIPNWNQSDYNKEHKIKVRFILPVVFKIEKNN